MALRLIVAALLSAVAFVLWATAPPLSATPTPAANLDERYTVTRVLDGDTITVNGGITIRYIGIDTPELYGGSESAECFAREAKQRNEKLLLGQTVRLKKDTSDTDTYGRLLRYVYLDNPRTSFQEQTSINEILVREGYAFARTVPPDVALQENLQQLEEDARKNKRGLWDSCK
jgi:micrococcal nuclease